MSLSSRGGIASRPTLSLALALAVVGVSALSASAADIIKVDNTDPLDLGTSWVGGVTPTSTDVGVFDNTLVTNSTFTFGINQTWGGIRIANPSAAITLNGTDSSTAVVLGTSGITMSSATQDLTFNVRLNTGNSQNWNIGAGRTMTVNGIYGGNSVAVTKSGTGTLTFTAANTNAGSLVLNNGVTNLAFGAVTSQILSNGVVNLAGGTLNLTGAGSQTIPTMNINTGASVINVAGTSTLTISSLAKSGNTGSPSGGVVRVMPTGGLSHMVVSATNMANGTATTVIGDNSGNPYVTLGYDDWAALDATGNVVAATYTDNATSGNDNVTADASWNGLFLNSVRFADSANAHVITNVNTSTPRGILVTSTSLGGTITGGSIRSNRGSGSGSTSGTTFPIIQNSTNADLTIASGIANAASSTPVGLIKAGIGRVVLTGSGGFTGSVWINEGTLAISTVGNITDNTSTMNLQGGKLEVTGSFANTKLWNVGEKGGTISVSAGNTLTNNNVLSGTGTLTKTGTGALVFASANTHTGAINVNAGTFGFTNTSGTATTGTITVASGGTLTGTGTTTGSVVVNGGAISPGIAGQNSSLGTITLGSLSFNSGSSLSYDVSAVGGDLINVTNGLTIGTGHSISLYAANTTNPYSSNGIFNIFNIAAGNVPAVSSFQSGFTVTNAVSGATYTWGQNGTFITLTISGLSLASQWNVNGGGTWNSAGNWTAGIPASAGDTATFGTVLQAGSASVTLDGNRTVGTVAFNNTAQSYTIAQGTSGSLILNNNTASAAISAIGNHIISAPVSLQSDVNVTTFAATDTLTLSGNVSGAKNVNVTGPGKIILASTNTYNDTLIATGATVQVGDAGTSGTLGSGTVSLAGTLAFNRTDAIDITSTLGGAGTLNQNGSGTVTLSGANALTGALNVNAGKLIVNNASALPTGALAVNGALELNGFNASASALSGTGTIANSAATPVTLALTGGGTFSGSISDNANGALSLVKNGGAGLTLSGTNTFTGPTSIYNAQIVITSSSALKNTSIINTGNSSGTGSVALGDGVVLDRTINVTGGSFESLQTTANASASFTGIMEGAGAGQIRINSQSTSTLTLLGAVNNTANAFTALTSGNIVVAGTASINATLGNIWIGRSTTAANVTVKDNATIIGAFGMDLGSGGANNPSDTFTIQDNAVVTLAGGFNLQGQAGGSFATPAVNTLNLNGGTLTTTGFSKITTGTAQLAVINLNGGQLIVPAAGATNASFIPNPLGTNNNSTVSVVLGTNGGKINVNDNNLTVNAPVTGSGNLSLTGTGTLTLGSNSGTGSSYTGVTTFTGGLNFSGGVAHSVGALRGNALSIDTNTSVTLPANAGTSKVSSLTIAGSQGAWNGKLDITNNVLAIQTTGGAAKAAALSDLANQVVSGNNGGTWDGKGITSSSNVGQPNATLAAVDNADLGWTTTTDGQTLDANSLFVTRAIIGDINLDGNVDLADYDRWYKNVGTGTAHSYAAGDINMDGNIDLADYDAWYKHVGAAPLTLASQPALGGGIAAVPEPASLAVLALGSAALLGSRRRRK